MGNGHVRLIEKYMTEMAILLIKQMQSLFNLRRWGVAMLILLQVDCILFPFRWMASPVLEINDIFFAF